MPKVGKRSGISAENSTTVISGDLLGNFNGNTISDSLRRAPGVSFQQDPQTADGTNIIVRGMSPDYNQVLLNGIALPEGSGIGRSANLSNLLSDSVSEIKISKTLLASQDSAGTGGLVEIETKSPLDRPRRYFNISADGTLRGKGYGQDYQLAATASARFGSNDQFGVSASFQYRDQDIATYGYTVTGTPGAYLPLGANGRPARIDDIDPRTPFPFEDGAEYLVRASQATRSIARSETTNVTLSAEWQVDNSTNLRFDYVRSRRTSESLDDFYDIRAASAGYDFLRPVPAENGQVRYVFGDFFSSIKAQSSVIYREGVEASTDSYSFRGTSALGGLTLDYRAGYARGSSKTPVDTTLSFSTDLPADSVNLDPSAVNSQTGTVVTLFGPRTGRGLPVPYFSAAGFQALANDTAPYLEGLSSVAEPYGGKSSNWSGRFDAKYEFGGGLLKYVQAGIDYKRANFNNTIRRTAGYRPIFDPVTYIGPRLPDIGIDFETIPFGPISNGNPIYRFATKESLLRLFGSLDTLVENGQARYFEDPFEAIRDDQYTREEDISGFVQARADIGKLEVIGGVRINRVTVEAAYVNGVSIFNASDVLDREYYTRTRTIVDGKGTRTAILPRILLNFRPEENLVLRAGYYSTVARPQIQRLSSEQTISFFARPIYGPNRTQPRLDITVGNPALKPATTHNFDVGGEWYDGNVGVIKANFFWKRIKNLLESNTLGGFDEIGDFELPDHPLLQPPPANTFVTLTTPINNPRTAEIWGAEFAAERRLTFLPGFLSGLGVYANYTYSKSRKTEERPWFTKPVYDNAGSLIRRETFRYLETRDFAQSPRHSGTVGLTYSKSGFDGSLYYTAQSRRRLATANFGLDTYNEAVNSLDFRGVYNFSLAGSDMRVSFEALNLLKDRADASVEESVGGVGSTPKYYTGGRFFGGRSFALGLSATF